MLSESMSIVSVQVELSSVDELESNMSRHVSVNESSDKNHHEETDVVDVTAAEFDNMSVDKHTQTPETVPTHCSTASADSQAAGSRTPSHTSDVPRPSQSLSTVLKSSVKHSDSSTQCVSPTEPTDSQKSASSGRKKNRSRKKNAVTASTSNTSVRCMYLVSFVSLCHHVICVIVSSSNTSVRCTYLVSFVSLRHQAIPQLDVRTSCHLCHCIIKQHFS